MAKLRRNHANQSKQSGGMITKVGIFGAIVAGLYALFNFFSGGEGPTIAWEDEGEPSVYAGELHFLPSEVSGSQVYHYKNYSLSYNEDYEQADWVAYILSREELQQPWSERVDNFRPDPAIRSGSATPNDYRGSGYDRGHMVPAADMAFDAAAMDETFLKHPRPRGGEKATFRFSAARFAHCRPVRACVSPATGHPSPTKGDYL